MVELVLRSIAGCMVRVRVNRIEWSICDGVPVIVKRRRSLGSVIIWLANRFLALAQSGVQMFVRTRDWIAWEQHCVRLLYPELQHLLVQSGASVRLPAMPGSSLRHLLKQGDIGTDAFVAAARELARAHRTQCCFFKAGWSHGDLHLDNVLYDAQSGRASLVDFDTRHLPGIDETWRHADDLKVLLLELIALRNDQWRPLAKVFLSEYGEARVLTELARQLEIPRGFAKILWYTRTGGRADHEIAPRIQILRETISRALGA